MGENFNDVHYLPDPTQVDGKWQEFDDVYGTKTDDSSRPMIKALPQGSSEDAANRATLITGSVYKIVFYSFTNASI